MRHLAMRCVWIRTCLLAPAIWLHACGGGGGGDSNASSKPKLTASPQQISVTADGDTSSVPTATVTFTLRNGSPNTTYVGVRYTRNVISDAQFTTAGTQGVLTMSFMDPTVIGLGTYSDTLQAAICKDSACAAIEDGSEVTVPITYTVTANSKVALSAIPKKTGPGVPTTLTWSSTHANSCTASGEWSGTFPSSGSQVVTPASLGDHVYALTCGDPGAPGEASITVAALPPVAKLSGFPQRVALGKTVSLRWKGKYAESCVASGDWSGSLPAEGFRTLSLTTVGTKHYHVDCSNAADTDGADVAVTVEAAPVAPPATAYRMSESHDGVLVTSNGITQPATSAPTWTRDFGARVSYPLIADGMVFVATAIPGDSYGNRLYGLNAATGATVWGPIHIPGVYFGSGLTYDDGRVFILMFDGAMRAFDAENGVPLWGKQLPGSWYSASPNAYGGILFVTGDGGLSALDDTSGAILWTDQSARATGWGSPAVSSEGTYIQTEGCNARAFDPVAGESLWEAQGSCDHSWDLPSVVKNGIFFGRSWGTVNLFDAVTGDFLRKIDSTLAPAVTDTAVITLNEDTLSSTQLSDFVQTWTFVGDGDLRTAPIVVNNTVYIGSASGKVHGLDRQTGSQVWMGQSPVPIEYDSETGGPMPPSGPAAGEDMLIFPAGNSLIAWKLQ